MKGDLEQPSADPGQTARRLNEEFAVQLGRPLAAGLYLVATPIGNLGDITLRALALLSRADVIYCEDTRHSRKLLNHFGVSRPLRAYHEHNAAEIRPLILDDIAAGKVVALISDAGTPLVSDPGFKLVRDCAAESAPVFVLPGPSATLSALAVSGLPTDCFTFAGFLPNRQAARRTRIGELAAAPGTLILFESANRLREALADLADLLGPRPAAIARELTKLHEQVLRGTLGELEAAVKSTPPVGEIVIVIAEAVAKEATDEEITRFLQAIPSGHSLRDAVDRAVNELGVPKKRAYALALALRQANEKEE